MMRVACICAIAAIGLAACGPTEDDILFDGQFFRASLKSERSTREDFVVTVRPVSASLLGAREAARFEAISYCVNRYGSSAINWVVGPDSPDEELPIADDTLTLQGRCPS
jgi:hypothetical protein